MTRILWDEPGKRFFETGVDLGVLYPPGLVPGVPWNGLVSVSESSNGGDLESLYYDGLKYADIIAAEEFVAELTAYGAPPEFDECDGRKQLAPGLFATQQPRKTFGFCYRTLIGNDLVGAEYGYKIHLVWNCTAAPTNKSNSTTTNTTEATTTTWSLATVPPKATTYKPTAHLIVDSRSLDPYTLQDLEDHLYGTDTKTPVLPSQEEVIHILTNGVTEFVEAFV